MINGRPCILWGKKRHIYAFAYMFEELPYYGYVCEEEDNQYDVSLERLTQNEWEALNKQEYFWIICDIDMTEYIPILQKCNLQEKINYINFEKYFTHLDPFNKEILGNRKIAIWGTGETEKNFQRACRDNGYDINVDVYIDNNMEKKGSQYCGYPVKMVAEIENIKEYFIIVASIYYYDIQEKLNELGLIEGKDYLPFSCFMSKPSAMLKELVYTKEISDFYCNRPYTMLYYAWFGVYPCCSTWVKYPIGNPAADSPHECWNSIVAKLYRLSADTRTYCFCKKDACPIIGNAGIKHEEKSDYAVPEQITLGLDYTCNLHCTSCRDNIQIVSGDQLEIRERFAEAIIETGWLEQTELLELSGTGEALFSKIDRKILFSNDQCKRESIALISNGLLLDENNLESLKKHFKKIRLNISIDAATETTYRKIRRGGDWKVLLNNLERVGKMRMNNEIEYVEIRMVVQKNNYKEMLDFIEMGRKYHVDQVVFTKLLNWDMYTTDEYLEQAMLNRDGSLQVELEQILRMNVFQDRIVQVLEFNRFL